MLVERHFKNEDKIKEMIVDGRNRGVCDKNGKPLSKFRVNCSITSNKYRENYVDIFGHN